MADQLPYQGPMKVECACGCGLFGTPKKNGHIAYYCKCPSCRGRRNRKKGAVKQRKVRGMLDIAGPSVGADHEEHWRHAVRWEVKGGKQVNPPWTWYLKMEFQSEQNRAIGDPRRFIGAVMPDGVSDGVAMIRMSELLAVAYDIVAYDQERRSEDDLAGNGRLGVGGSDSETTEDGRLRTRSSGHAAGARVADTDASGARTQAHGQREAGAGDQP